MVVYRVVCYSCGRNLQHFLYLNYVKEEKVRDTMNKLGTNCKTCPRQIFYHIDTQNYVKIPFDEENNNAYAFPDT